MRNKEGANDCEVLKEWGYPGYSIASGEGYDDDFAERGVIDAMGRAYTEDTFLGEMASCASAISG